MSQPQKIPEQDPPSDSAERRSLAEALAHERNVLRTMIDLIPAFIYAKDTHSRFTACNRLVAERMGTDPCNLVGKTDFDFFPREMAEKFFADEQELIRSGKPLIDHEEIAFDKLTGTDRVILTSKVPLRDAAGNLIGIVGTGFDITDRKTADERIASSDRLESIGRLAAGVAHEINTPIQFLGDSFSFISDAVDELLEYVDTLHAELPKPRPPNEDVDYLRSELPKSLKLAAEGIGRIAEIVRSMKEFARPDQNSMVAVDLNRLIGSMLVITRSEYRDFADLVTEFAELPNVVCNGGQINQVVLNLVVNAAHAIADNRGGARGRITVATRVDGEHAVISVGDDGGGIPEHVQSKIFDPFFTTKEVGRGTGQGLSVARNVVVRGHGGSISFETTPGIGTTFHVRLPLARRS